MAANAPSGSTFALTFRHARVVLWMLLLAFTVRGLVPAGYMPDASALEKGRIELTFCTAAGTVSTISVSLTDDSADAKNHGDNAASGMDCPFGLLTHVAAAPPVSAPAVALPIQASPPVQFEVSRALPALPAQGPPLGSRAPPSFLG